MSSKPLDHKDPARVQGATVLGPGDFPIGSMQSRAAARLRLQKIGEAGKASSECICFPEDEQPFFHLFVPAWHWQNEMKFRWPRLSAQYRKAWKASFTTGHPMRVAINRDQAQETATETQ